METNVCVQVQYPAALHSITILVLLILDAFFLGQEAATNKDSDEFRWERKTNIMWNVERTLLCLLPRKYDDHLGDSRITLLTSTTESSPLTMMMVILFSLITGTLQPAATLCQAVRSAVDTEVSRDPTLCPGTLRSHRVSIPNPSALVQSTGMPWPHPAPPLSSWEPVTWLWYSYEDVIYDLELCQVNDRPVGRCK